MKAIHLIPVLAITAITSFANSATAQEASFLNAEEMKWQDAPPSLPKGGKMAVLYGDPAKEGTYSIRAKLPASYVVPPHFHTTDENITVLSGALFLGMSDNIDKKNAHALKAGGFHHLPGKLHHYAFTKAPTVIQISGEGPFDINYLNPADDPRNKK